MISLTQTSNQFGSPIIFRFGHRFEGFKNAVRARIDAHRRDMTPTNDALGIDDKQRPLRLSVFLPVDAVLTSHSALGSKSAKSGKWNLRSLLKARWHQTPSTEMPMICASNSENSGFNSL